MQDRTAAEDIARKVVEKLESGAIEGVPTVEGVQDLVERDAHRERLRAARPSPTSSTAPSAAASATMNTPPDADIYEDITFYKAAVDSRHQARKRQHRRRYRHGRDAQVRLRGRQAVQRDVRAQARSTPRRTATATSTSTTWTFYTLTTTCCQIDLHQAVRGRLLHRPRRICASRTTSLSYAALACIAIQANQNDQHGGQSIVQLRLRPWPRA